MVVRVPVDVQVCFVIHLHEFNGFDQKILENDTVPYRNSL